MFLAFHALDRCAFLLPYRGYVEEDIRLPAPRATRRSSTAARSLLLVGIRVNTIFAVTFAVGSGLAGLGGALGAEIIGLDPTFPLKFMVYFLIVVSVGGTSSMTGPLVASILLGVADVLGKYYVPSLGGFIIYIVLVAVLVVRPQGLFSRAG
ncbi:hypothetical protein ACC817_33315 [Rhizobium ruizarguesonis]|uniref:ABC transporter permease subunit n=1 Tax=Rhizobium ruizarguesonis TaxID=2081791 RepID=UPI0024788D64|nr:hypothetical protein [Rhizobium ruizarguesonis]